MDNQTLIKPPTLKEIRTALFSIDSNKTPGPDGFGAGFFKTYWHILKVIFLIVWLNSFAMVNY